MFIAIDVALTLHRAVNHVVEILPRLVVGRDDERRVRVFDVLVGDGGEAFVARSDFVYTALVIESFDSPMHVAARKLFNDFLQLGIALPHDIVKMGGTDSRFLELVIRPAGLDGFMLAHVTDEQHAILGTETLQKRVHLSRARHARFVEDIQPLLIRGAPIR